MQWPVWGIRAEISEPEEGERVTVVGLALGRCPDDVDIPPRSRRSILQFASYHLTGYGLGDHQGMRLRSITPWSCRE